MKKRVLSLLLTLTLVLTSVPVSAETQTITEETLEVSEPSVDLSLHKGAMFAVSLPKSIELDDEVENLIKAGIYLEADVNQKLVVEPIDSVTETSEVIDFTLSNVVSNGEAKEDITAEVAILKSEWNMESLDLCDDIINIALEENLVDICSISLTEELPTGKWSGQLPIRIALIEDNSFRIDITNNGETDLNGKGTVITGDTRDVLLTELVDSGFIESVDDIGLLLDVTCDDFDNIAEATFNVRRIAEPGESIAVYHYNETDSVWEFIDTVVVDDNYSITCSFTSFSPVALQGIGHEHRYLEGFCSCGKVQGAGLYDIQGRLVCSWEESGIDVEQDLTGDDFLTNTTSARYVLNEVHPEVTEVIVPEDISHIGDHQFYTCINIRRVTFPNSVESIGIRGMTGCINLEYLRLSENINSLGHNAFSSCSSLKSIINFEKMKVTDLPGSVLLNCSTLESITLPSTLKSIGSTAFRNCASLKTITIPSTVTSLGGSTFWDCTSLTDIIIQGNITSIELTTFKNCTSLSNVVIPSTVTSIGYEAFYNCTSLQNLQIPSTVTDIGSYAFEGCTGFRDLTIPSSVTGIGNGAFLNVPHITYKGSYTNGAPWGALTMN